MYFYGSETATLSRKDLYRKVWEKSAVQLAKELGISDVAIAKLCKKHHVPKPPLGYWARIQNGQKICRPSLPKLDDEELEIVRYQRSESPRDFDTKDPETVAKIAAEKDEASHIVVGEHLVEPHPLVERTRKSLASAAVDERGIVRPKAKQCLTVAVAKASTDRAMRIMDALLKAVDGRGYKVSVVGGEEGYPASTIVEVLNEAIKIGLSEEVNRKERPPTPKQVAERQRFGFSWDSTEYDYTPSGHLTLSILTGGHDNLRRNWTDTVHRRIESCLNPFLAALIKVAEQEKVKRIEAERREREWKEVQRRREDEARRIAEEKARRDDLDDKASAWRKSQRLREYIAAVQSAATQKLGQIDSDSELGRWLSWAKQRADQIDPIVAVLGSFDKKGEGQDEVDRLEAD